MLALRGARLCNGVSSLQGHVSRQMWQRLFAIAEAQVPIGHITNGVHVLSWLAPSMKRIYDRVLGEGWTERQWEPETWEGLAELDPAELWEAHSTLRLHLVDFVRRRSRGAIRLDPDALTIGFARRFATYKRATLLVSDPDWLERLCADASRPVQFVIAGKAHPRDDAGKDLIRRIIAMSRDTRFRGRIVFVADYDINVARHLMLSCCWARPCTFRCMPRGIFGTTFSKMSRDCTPLEVTLQVTCASGPRIRPPHSARVCVGLQNTRIPEWSSRPCWSIRGSWRDSGIRGSAVAAASG